MPNAIRLFSEMREEMSALEERIRNHPFVAAVESGTLKREVFLSFAGEQYHIIESDLRSVANLVSRYPMPPAHDFFWGTLQGEKAAFEKLLLFGKALGLDRFALSSHEPDPRAHAYTAYMAWLGAYGTAGEVAAAFALNFSAWGENCGRMSAGLQRHYGFSSGDVGFFDLFANPPVDLEEQAAAIADLDLSQGIAPTRIKRSARLLQAYELMFWDAMENLANA